MEIFGLVFPLLFRQCLVRPGWMSVLHALGSIGRKKENASIDHIKVNGMALAVVSAERSTEVGSAASSSRHDLAEAGGGRQDPPGSPYFKPKPAA